MELSLIVFNQSENFTLSFPDARYWRKCVFYTRICCVFNSKFCVLFSQFNMPTSLNQLIQRLEAALQAIQDKKVILRNSFVGKLHWKRKIFFNNLQQLYLEKARSEKRDLKSIRWLVQLTDYTRFWSMKSLAATCCRESKPNRKVMLIKARRKYHTNVKDNRSEWIKQKCRT